MTDTTLPPDGPQHDRIEPVDIQQEMQRSYIDYAMSVIVGRALPEVRDGLKPVHRRVLYAMYDNGFRPDRGHAKSARSGRRDDGQLPPTRRLVHLRHPGPDGPAVVTAVPAGRRAGQLRLAAAMIPAAAMRYTEAQAHPAGDGDVARNRRGDSRFRPRTTTAGCKSLLSCPAGIPNLSGQRLGRHRRRHGHQHAAAQPSRSSAEAVFWCAGQLRGRRGSHSRGGHRTGQGSRLPDATV